jgi:tetratricopeptide (TPR) repeat protein
MIRINNIFAENSMAKLKYKVLPILLLFFATELHASFRSEVYHAYLQNRMELWKGVIDRMSLLENKNNELILELVNYQYGYIGYCVEFKKNEEAKKYLDIAENYIDILEKKEFKLSDVYAYRSAFYGLRIELNPLVAPYYGIKSIKYAKLALKLDSNNYLAYLQNGNVRFHMPESVGGSKIEGINYYLQARKLIEKNPVDIRENWNYLNLLTITGQSYTALENYSSAMDIYEYILKLEPGFTYVRNTLYPDLLRKINN